MAEVIEQTLNRVPHAQALDLEGYMACDAEARRVAREAVNKLKVSR